MTSRTGRPAARLGGDTRVDVHGHGRRRAIVAPYRHSLCHDVCTAHFFSSRGT
jgi:hypothetical protein